MENKMQVFSNEEFGEIRTLVIEGAPWFVGIDLASALGYKDTDKAIRDHVAAEDKRLFKPADLAGLRSDATFTINSPRGCVFVNESGMYALIFGSKLERAKEFKHWVTSVVLPSIREKGYYAAGASAGVVPAITAEFLRKIADAMEAKDARIQRLEEKVGVQRQQIAELEPKAAYYDLLLSCKDVVTIGVIAQDYGMGAREMNELLKKLGLQYQVGSKGNKYWLLTKKAREMQKPGERWTQTELKPFLGYDGQYHHGKPFMKWTQHGRIALYHILKAWGILPVTEAPNTEITLWEGI